MAALGCMFLAVPPVIVGIAAKHTNFTLAGYPGSYRLSDEDSARVLPVAILYLTTGMKAFFGLVSIAAAVMSSADSSMLSASTMITRNVYQTLLRPTATEKEVVIALRTTICALGLLSVYMALSVKSVFDLWNLCSDIVYVLLFPPLLCVFYFKETNAYGSVLAFIVSGAFRCLCGEPSMNLPVIVRLPLYDEELGQRFPFRLLSMALGLTTLLLGSYAAGALFRSGLLSDSCDVFSCFVKPPPTCQHRGSSIASFDRAPGTGNMGNENTLVAHTGPRHVATTDTANERERATKRVSKDHWGPLGVTELPDGARDGKRLSTRQFPSALYRISSPMQSGWVPAFTQRVSAADRASEREAVTSGVSNDNRRLSAELPAEAQNRNHLSTRAASLVAEHKSAQMQSGWAPTNTQHVSTAHKTSEREVITSGVSKGSRRIPVAAEPFDDAQAGGGFTRKKSSLASDRKSSVMQLGSSPTGARHVSATHTSITWGLSKKKRTQPIAAEPADEDQDGSGLNARKASLASVRKRSSGLQSSRAHESSRAVDKSQGRRRHGDEDATQKV
ncbi:uncharacterized protein LOC142573982 [Dermacentor variabilis]|uniref:uncharacterized protein LOC142573982 n=1 Tax=Dermacentor variabilis TaxID=34621 RepID=UPI003F5BB0A2